jgi:hypothetical protein
MKDSKMANSMIRRTLFLMFVLLGAAGSASATQCQEDIAAIDKALDAPDVDADIRTQAEDMRSQAVQLCGAGNDEEGIAVTTEAKALLNIE